MTENEWLNTRDPKAMLTFLQDIGQLSERKARLFAVACCWRIMHLMPDKESRAAVHVAEDFAAGITDEATRQLAEERAETVRSTQQEQYDREVNESTYAESDEVIAAGWTLLTTVDAAAAARAMVSPSGVSAAREASEAASTAEEWTVQAARFSAGVGRGPENTCSFSEKPPQAELARCIFGSPFHPVPHIDPTWLAWGGGTVKRLAEAAYEERQLPAGTLDVARLAVLADALEEAGCNDAGLLGHLRSEGPHVRGCWALDLVRSVD
jgi:hypothetical protein